MKKVNIAKASEILGVSNATIRNWIRHNYLTPLENGKDIIFDNNEVKKLKENILNGNIARLNKRANKRNSKKFFIPKEYIGDEILFKDLTAISNYILQNSLRINQSIFLLSLNLLIKGKFIFTDNLEKLLTFKESDYKNKHVLKLLKEFHFHQIQKFLKAHKYYKILW